MELVHPKMPAAGFGPFLESAYRLVDLRRSDGLKQIAGGTYAVEGRGFGSFPPVLRIVRLNTANSP